MTEAPSFIFDILYEDDGFGIDNDTQRHPSMRMKSVRRI
jgi:hypothetical protein